MITYWQMTKNGALPLNTFEKGCVIKVTAPSENELKTLKSTLKIPEDFLADILDIDERSRLEFEDNQYLATIHNKPAKNTKFHEE